jgi:hypothetical protein
MFAEPIHFHSIRIPLPRRAIYSRLGFRKGLTMIKPGEQEMVERHIEDGSKIVMLKGAARIIPIQGTDDVRTALDGGLILPSRALSRMLVRCTHVLMMGATSGPAIMDAISSATEAHDLTRAVVLDATASEMTDEALTWIMNYINHDLRRNSLVLTRKRFSAGYGDFSLENQKAIYHLLHLEIIGVTLMDTCILIPEKSVTAIAGIRTSRQKPQ